MADQIDYDTGVSNGDVDWLFRGKSKKLTKKMNGPERRTSIADTNDNAKEKRVASKTDANIEGGSIEDKKEAGASTSVSNNSSSSMSKSMSKSSSKNSSSRRCSGSEVKRDGGEAKEDNGKSQNGEIELRKTNDKFGDSIAAKSGDRMTEKTLTRFLERNRGSEALSALAAPALAPPAPPEKTSKLDLFRLGRSRSSSTGSANFHVPSTLPAGRRSSVNTIPSLSSQTSQSSPLMFQSSASSGSTASQESSPNVSRSNSTGKTRSLLSSLSAKFKPGGSTTSSTPTSSSNSSPKLNPLLIGSSSNANLSNQSLVTLTDTPPRDFQGDILLHKMRKFSFPDGSGGNSGGGSVGIGNGGSGGISSYQDGNSMLSKTYIRTLGSDPATKKVSLRRVTFALDQMAYDPQQQIPSRRPRRGNVLVPDDILDPPPQISQGISSLDTKPVKPQESKFTEREIKQAIENHNRALVEAEKHAHEAHMSARRIAQEVSQLRVKVNPKVRESTEEDDEPVSAVTQNIDSKNITIDKPLHAHENHFDDIEEVHHQDPLTSNEAQEEEIVQNLSLETIYTRCCHLREILPIPATLNQLKNKKKPLQVLKLSNPKPTLIDVLSFSDFIAITPIYTVIFDNVTMTTEMLKHFLASLVRNKYVEKLSLRNVAIDAEGWLCLCQLLSSNQSIKKLDISQQRVKSDLKSSFLRSSMDWNAFIDVLISRGGIAELVINGCKLPDKTFKDLITKAVSPATYRLGVAATELNCCKARIIADWIGDENSKCVGVDLAFNNLSNGQLKYFIEAFERKSLKLIFLSLNSTKLTDVDETTLLLKALVNVKTLRFLDLSSLPELFPRIISRLNKYLPQYPSLKRIHFDLNDLTSQSIGAIADILPKINGLLHVSFLGNKGINHGSAATIYTAVKLSHSIFTLDLDYSLIPDKLSQRIAFYLMRNMDNVMNSDGVISNGPSSDNRNSPHNNDNNEELMFDGSLLMETAEKLLIENDKKSDSKTDSKIQKIIINALIERTRAVRKDIHQNIDDLFKRRNEGTLSLEGKETLLRLCLLDSSLEKVVHMFEERDILKNSGARDQLSPSPSFNSLNDHNDPAKELNEQAQDMVKNNNLNHILLSNDDQSEAVSGSHPNLHQNSNELITSGSVLTPRNVSDLTACLEPTFQPHQVVIESSADGTNMPVDNLTGRPVLMRSISHTSKHAKKQEQEEGELHRWGFFMQRRNNSAKEQSLNTTNDKSSGIISENKREVPTLNMLPSGDELRDAIIAAKGIESITDLIDNIHNNRLSIDNIYNLESISKNKSAEHPLKEKSHLQNTNKDGNTNGAKSGEVSSEVGGGETGQTDCVDLKQADFEKPDGTDLNPEKLNAVVDEAYDKLLNDAQRFRSNK